MGCYSLSFKNTDDDNTGSYSRRVDCVLCVWAVTAYHSKTHDDNTGSYSRRVDCVLCLWAVTAYHSKPQWMILEGHTVGGLTVFFVGCFS